MTSCYPSPCSPKESGCSEGVECLQAANHASYQDALTKIKAHEGTRKPTILHA